MVVDSSPVAVIVVVVAVVVVIVLIVVLSVVIVVVIYIIKNCHKFNAKNLCKHNIQNNFHELTGTLGHNLLEFRNYRSLEKV